MINISPFNHETKASQVYQLVRQVAAKVGPHRTRTSLTENITNLQIEALVMVDRLGSPTMRELAKGLMIVQPSVTRIAYDLVKKGLLRRIRERRDRRVTRLRITPVGKVLSDRIRIEGFMLLNQVLGRMDTNDQEALVKGLESFLNAIAITEQDILKNCDQRECNDLVIDTGLFNVQKGQKNGD